MFQVYSIVFVFAKFISQIDQKITEFVTEQQKIDAKQSHDKSELEQLKQDIANANKQKKLVSKALENKVSWTLPDFMCISLPLCASAGGVLPILSLSFKVCLFRIFLLLCRRNHLQMYGLKSISLEPVWP